MTPLSVLKSASFGKRTAEEEREHLRTFFVETDQWRRVIDGEIDVVYGSKGAGKSAIYSLISLSSEELKKRDIIVVEGENPQGAPAFKDISKEPPFDEFEFVNLWKLYILTLCGHTIKERGIKTKNAIQSLMNCRTLVSSLLRSLLVAY